LAVHVAQKKINWACSGEVVVIADPQQNKSKKLTSNLPADKNNEARIKEEKKPRSG